MDLLNDLLKRKAKQINLDEKRQDLVVVGDELVRFFPKDQVRVVAVTDKTMTIQAKNSPLASEVRMSQIVILEAASKAIKKKLTKLYVRTGR